jgi:hypothetical protein
MVKPQVQQTLTSFFGKQCKSSTELSHDLENQITDYFIDTVPDLVRPEETVSKIQTKPRGYKSGVVVSHSPTTTRSKMLQKQFKDTIFKSANSATGLLFAEVKFDDKPKILFKNDCALVKTNVHYSTVNVKFLGKDSDKLPPILLNNLHEGEGPAFWKAILGLFIKRSYISNYKKLRYNCVHRYYPKADPNNKVTRIYIVNKGETLPNKRTCLQNRRTSSMNSYANKNIGGRIVLLKDVLEHSERIGLALITVLQTVVNPGGETKGNACRINGKPTPQDILRVIDKKPHLDSTGCSPSKVTSIKVSENSARMQYVPGSKNDVITSFQCAKFFSRHIFRSSKCHSLLRKLEAEWDKHLPMGVPTRIAMPFIEAYLKKLKSIAIEYFPEFVKSFDINKYWNENLDLASNLIDNQISTAHLHMDTKSSFPAILTAMNPIPSRPWEGGELFVSNGACLLNYAGGSKSFSDMGDMILMDADQLSHSVMAMNPGKDVTHRQMVRISHVLYNNGPKGTK